MAFSFEEEIVEDSWRVPFIYRAVTIKSQTGLWDFFWLALTYLTQKEKMKTRSYQIITDMLTEDRGRQDADCILRGDRQEERR